MNRIRSAFGGTSLVRDERGLSTVEYVIILVLIAAAAIGLWVSFGGKIKDKLTDVNTEMDKVKIEKTQ
ncbi:MAG TPA: Flp family type IVb pilin [Polyangiaceae bacterium]|nr:Flp family type IVb pilin [Polyangiaceae bacterium]